MTYPILVYSIMGLYSHSYGICINFKGFYDHWQQRISSNEEPLVSNCACYIHKYYNCDIGVLVYYRLALTHTLYIHILYNRYVGVHAQTDQKKFQVVATSHCRGWQLVILLALVQLLVIVNQLSILPFEIYSVVSSLCFIMGTIDTYYSSNEHDTYTTN